MEDQQPEIIDDIELLKKPKPKRPQSDAQKAVWAKAQQTRLNNAKLKKDALNKAKEDIESAKAKASSPMSPPVDLAKPKVKSSPKIVYQEESEDEPEVIVVKKKKKKPPVIYQEESSSEEEAPPPKKVSIPRYSAPIAPMAPKPIVRFF